MHEGLQHICVVYQLNSNRIKSYVTGNIHRRIFYGVLQNNSDKVKTKIMTLQKT